MDRQFDFRRSECAVASACLPTTPSLVWLESIESGGVSGRISEWGVVDSVIVRLTVRRITSRGAPLELHSNTVNSIDLHFDDADRW